MRHEDDVSIAMRVEETKYDDYCGIPSALEYTAELSYIINKSHAYGRRLAFELKVESVFKSSIPLFFS